MENSNNLTPFEGERIRKIWHDEQWYFSVVDIIHVLTDSPIPKTYWSKMKTKIKVESESYPNTVQLKLKAADGKNYKTDCANTEGVFRILMSVPSPKAEPFKLWLANLGKQAIDEAENPELLTERQAELYRAKGYSNEWVSQRLKTIEVRKELTDEWKGRDVKEGQEYAILTATIAKGTFGLTPSEHKNVKGLAQQNLRDHMTPLELIFTALSEETTRQFIVRDDAQGFNENHDAAQRGGTAMGNARQNYEKETGLKVVSKDNYLGLKGVDNKELPSDD
jgi:DNA-damage-inducible protein D